MRPSILLQLHVPRYDFVVGPGVQGPGVLLPLGGLLGGEHREVGRLLTVARGVIQRIIAAREGSSHPIDVRRWDGK